MKKNRIITPDVATIMHRVLRSMNENMDTPKERAAALKQQAIAFKHFNGPHRSGFSHTSLGARFRRYGK